MKTYRLRNGSRRSVRCEFLYFWNGALDKGMVWDVSETGWRATSSTSIPIGSETTAYLALPAAEASESKYVLIDRARVCWTDGSTIGWTITHIAPDAQERLERYVRNRKKR